MTLFAVEAHGGENGLQLDPYRLELLFGDVSDPGDLAATKSVDHEVEAVANVVLR